MSNKIYIGTEEIGGSGGSADLTNYYNKSHIDSSYGVIDASLKYLDASALAFDASIKELAARPGGGGGSNISKLSDLTNDCDFRPITYITKDDYDDLVEAETLDDDTMYVITDLADTDDLASLVSIEDLSTAKAQINASLSSTANTIITEANTSINYWRTTYVTNANSSINSIKNTAISAVQNQQSTSVSAVNTAKTNANSSINSAKESALSDISTFSADKIASMPTFVVMTESDYQQITPNSSTIYFLT